MPVSLFVSHKLQRDTAETDPGWRYRNAAGQQVLSNWTYGPGFVPRFGPPFMGTHSMVQGSALSPGYRAEGLAEYGAIQERYGPVSICFDQFHAWPQPDYNSSDDATTWFARASAPAARSWSSLATREKCITSSY